MKNMENSGLNCSREKAGLEGLLRGAGHRVLQSVKLSEQTFAFACAAQERFAQGDAKTKKEILLARGSNLILKDKMLCIETTKPFFILENSLSSDEHQNATVEPEDVGLPQGQQKANASPRPRLLGDLDEARTWMRKMERAAALIYAHFKKEFGTPLQRYKRI